MPLEHEVDIFYVQEQVINSIIQSSQEQVAMEEAPRLLDPIQQTIATTLRSYMNSPAVSRKEVISAIKLLNEPQLGVHIKTLRKAYEAFQTNPDVVTLLTAVQSLGSETAAQSTSAPVGNKQLLKREDLKLICFDYVWS